MIDSCLTDEQYAEGLRAVKQETWANIGGSAVAVAEYLVAKCDELQKRKGDKK